MLDTTQTESEDPGFRVTGLGFMVRVRLLRSELLLALLLLVRSEKQIYVRESR